MERSSQPTDRDPVARPTGTVGAVVVCGGRSRRMGSDKAEVRLAGSTLLERVIAELQPVTQELVLACGPEPRYEELGLPLALDHESDAGPLAGIAAGLERLETPWVIVVAVDMPRLSRNLFDALVTRAQERELDVCYFESEGGIEPLCAVYHRRCLEPIRTALAAGRRKVTAFTDETSGQPLRVGRLPVGELSETLRVRDCAVNLNTPDELKRERSSWDEGAFE